MQLNAPALPVSTCVSFLGTIVELPYSGSPQLMNMWALTNIGEPGLWLYKISQGATPNPASIESAGNFDENNVLDNIACKGPLLTLQGQAWAHVNELTEFRIQRCKLPAHGSLDAQVIGQLKSELTETRPRYDDQTSELFIKFDWFFREPVIVIILLDGAPLDIQDLGKMVFFYDPVEDREEMLQMFKENNIIRVTDEEGDDLIGEDKCLQEFTDYGKY